MEEDKTDGPPEDDLARKIARRDTIAREKEINELKLNANNKDMQSLKNDVRIIVLTFLFMSYRYYVVCANENLRSKKRCRGG